MNEKPIVFFDGICHLCNGFVDAMVLRDHQRQYYFAPLQGSTAKSILSSNDFKDLDSIVLWHKGKTYKKSNAVLKIIMGLGGIYRLWGIGYLVPEFLRNWIYDQIAKRRYLWFGERQICRLPTPEERDFLLP